MLLRVAWNVVHMRWEGRGIHLKSNYSSQHMNVCYSTQCIVDADITVQNAACHYVLP